MCMVGVTWFGNPKLRLRSRYDEKRQLFLLLNLFLLLFMGLIALFDIIHGSYHTVSTSF